MAVTSPTSATLRGLIRLALLAACLGCGALAASGCGSIAASAGRFTPGTPGVLTVATSVIPTPGFWEGTPAHPIGGFEDDLAEDLARRFGLDRVAIRMVPFDRIVAGDLGGADLGIDLTTPTGERERALDFSTPYLKAAPTVVVRSGTEVPDLETAQKLRWGAVRSTTFVDIIADSVAPKQRLTLVDSREELVALLEAGRVEAAIFDLPLAVAVAADSEGRLEAVAQLPDPETIAVALPKGSPNRQAVDSAIRAFTADGTIDRLLHTWVGADAAEAETAIPLLHTSLG